MAKRAMKTLGNEVKLVHLVLRFCWINISCRVRLRSSNLGKALFKEVTKHLERQGNQWYFGMKIHIGVDAGFSMIHSLDVTPANVHDLNVSHALRHGDETHVYGDSGYLGIHKRAEHHHRDIEWFIARLLGKTRQPEPGNNRARVERIKASVWAKVEHLFRTIKSQFDCSKVRYCGLADNAQPTLYASGVQRPTDR